MLGIGWTEMLVVGVIALIVIGPKELPAVMQKIGRFAGTVRRMGADFQRELNKTTGLDEVKNLRNAITQPLKQTTESIRKEFNATSASGKVEPSGALKPADPKAESVVDEIHKAAGLPKPAEPAKGAVTSSATAGVKAAEPIKAATTGTAVAAAATTAEATPPAPAKKKAAAKKSPAKKKTAAKKSPAKAAKSAKAADEGTDKPKTPRKRKSPAKKTS